AQTSLWVPAKPEHAKLGWSYDFEQTERIARAAYDSTGYDATMEVVEFVMAEADRRHRTTLTAERAALEAQLAEKDKEIAELREAVEPFSRLASVLCVGDADDAIVIGVSAGDLRRLVNARRVCDGGEADD